MAELFRLSRPEDALEALLSALPSGTFHRETLPLEEALGRVCSREIRSPQALPSFVRSTMDGYAVRAADTYGASEGLPAYLQLTGEVPMGAAPSFSLKKGECALVHTGGMIPEGSDAVVMVERTQKYREDEIEVLRSVAEGENLVQIGEDVAAGSLVFPAGHLLRPQDIGGLSALGIESLEVAGKPKVAIISTGDEVVPPGTRPEPGQVRDINSYTLSALISDAGGIPVKKGIIADDYKLILSGAKSALEESEALIISAGSSVSVRDVTAEVIDELGKPGVLVHGVSIKPGKPTILAVCDGKPVIGLPGNPVSAFVAARLFLLPLVRRLLGTEENPLNTAERSVRARLSRNIASSAGRSDYVPVRLIHGNQELPEAEPVFGKSNLIYTLIRADGLVSIPEEANGLHRDDEITVRLF
ncbi:gephyrin-like molybdotransferase Glp [Marispirochaeta aestuarii]|uniref:molybdopterin molybdotransferase MoeA n=1 Tax=Marispirochaeta aestuarii TaxID=1963862 RepID=UPI0029C6C735|nr:gephyrin-like molybdotransferase Glp [Marispirochaeta aestuarii]